MSSYPPEAYRWRWLQYSILRRPFLLICALPYFVIAGIWNAMASVVNAYYDLRDSW